MEMLKAKKCCILHFIPAHYSQHSAFVFYFIFLNIKRIWAISKETINEMGDEHRWSWIFRENNTTFIVFTYNGAFINGYFVRVSKAVKCNGRR